MRTHTGFPVRRSWRFLGFTGSQAKSCLHQAGFDDTEGEPGRWSPGAVRTHDDALFRMLLAVIIVGLQANEDVNSK